MMKVTLSKAILIAAIVVLCAGTVALLWGQVWYSTMEDTWRRPEARYASAMIWCGFTLMMCAFLLMAASICMAYISKSAQASVALPSLFLGCGFAALLIMMVVSMFLMWPYGRYIAGAEAQFFAV
jgi:hypothetical protein